MKKEFSIELPSRYFDPTKWPHGSCYEDLSFEGWCNDCNQHTKICHFELDIAEKFEKNIMNIHIIPKEVMPDEQ